MNAAMTPRSHYGLEKHGILNAGAIYWNLPTPFLYEQAIRRREGRLSHLGPLVVRTGQHTGRAPKDKFIVLDEETKSQVWWGEINQEMEPARFQILKQRLLAYWQTKDLFVQDCLAGADPRYAMPIRVITEAAWHSLFARNLFIQADHEQLMKHVPEFTLFHAPNFHAIPDMDGTRSEAFVVINFKEKLILIGGTHYGGEMKKSIFTVLNYLLPQRDVLTMHCSANKGKDDDVAIFFGLSGTGKTTLSTDRARTLIGDDEHGWSKEGIFNLEGGCYAKVIRLSPEAEPEIYETTRRFGTILENVGFNSVTGKVDLNEDLLTENTRAAYPMSHIPSAMRRGMGSHPRNIIMLTADAFGVMPPVAKLTPAQAVYYFLSGYTAKVAGTETGVTEPQATFSACFGAPFMVLSPSIYSSLLGERIAAHDVKVWMVNTGWSGGPYGVGQRISIGHTRAILKAALEGSLGEVPTREDSNFRLQVPEACPGVPSEILDPRSTWKDKHAYDEQAKKVAEMFVNNFKQFEEKTSPDIRNAGPRPD